MIRRSILIILLIQSCFLIGCYVPYAGVAVHGTAVAANTTKLHLNEELLRSITESTKSVIQSNGYYAVSAASEVRLGRPFRTQQTFFRSHPYGSVRITVEGNGKDIINYTVGFSDGMRWKAVRKKTIAVRDAVARELKNKLGDEHVLVTQY